MERDYILLGMLSLSGFLFLLSLIFGIISYTVDGGSPFQYLAGDLTDKHTVQFSPEGWIYPFWNSILWIWMTLLFVYLAVNVFRENRDGKMYCNPPLVTREVAGLLSLTFVLHIIWLFLWDIEEFIGTTIVLLLLTISSWTTLVIFTIRLLKATPFLFHHTRRDLWIFRVLVQNGLGAYSTWMTFEFLLKLTVALTLSYGHEEGNSYPTPSAFAVIILNFILAVTFPLEMISWEKAVRYLISPAFVVLSVISSIYVRLETVPHQDETMRVYSMVMLVFATLLLLARSANMVIRHFRNPLVPYV